MKKNCCQAKKQLVDAAIAQVILPSKHTGLYNIDVFRGKYIEVLL
jgi:hypothetical protein